MSDPLVSEHADLVEEIASRGTGETFSLAWRGGTSAQRAAAIDHWHAIADELSRRGWIVMLAIDRDEPGVEKFCIRVAPDE
jgi:hypothetical protein